MAAATKTKGAKTAKPAKTGKASKHATDTVAALSPAVLADDAILAAAAELAREALGEIAEPHTIGVHIGMTMVQDLLGMHFFECRAPGYRGWYWGASVARVADSEHVTVCETNLLPGPQALLAPEWVPYADRLAPGDLGPGDELPFRGDDPLLEAGFEATGDEEVDALALFELGLGRRRVLSAEGREAAATRWYDGERGPTSPLAQRASAPCATCGFYIPLAGALRAMFGVCANEWSPSDGTVVSIDHGCGAHSETDAPAPEPITMSDPVMDDLAIDVEVAERSEPAEDVAEVVEAAEVVELSADTITVTVEVEPIEAAVEVSDAAVVPEDVVAESEDVAVVESVEPSGEAGDEAVASDSVGVGGVAPTAADVEETEGA